MKIFKIYLIIIFLININIIFADENNNQIGVLKNDVKSNLILDFLAERIAGFISKRIDNIILKNGFNDHIERILNLESSIKYEITQEGNSERSIKCGQMGNFDLIFEDIDGLIKNDPDENKNTTITVGASGLKKFFELGVLNMKEGEERRIQIDKIYVSKSQKFQSEIKKEKLKRDKKFLRVKLNYISDNKKNIEISDFYENIEKNKDNHINSYHIRKSLSQEIHCGAVLKFDIKILNVNGLILYDMTNNEKKLFQIGNSNSIFLDFHFNKMHYGDKKIVFINLDDLININKIN